MIARSFFIIVLAVALAACGRDGSAAELDAPIQLAPGQSAVFADPKLEVHFSGIENDSRCPADVTCVWAGEIIVQLTVRSGGKTTQHSIKETESATVAGATITVLQVLPARTSSQRIAPDDYRVTLKVTR
jgi:hypothetical protein